MTNSFPAFLVSLVCETTGALYAGCCKARLWVISLPHSRKVEHIQNRVEHLLDCAGTGMRLLGDKETLRRCPHISPPSHEWLWEVWMISYPPWHVYSSKYLCPSRYKLLCTSMPRIYSTVSFVYRWASGHTRTLRAKITVWWKWNRHKFHSGRSAMSQKCSTSL